MVFALRNELAALSLLGLWMWFFWFYRDHRVVGTAIVEDDRVWMSCTCGAVTRELS